MEKLKRCGEMWIKFDENGLPEYGFDVENYTLKKFKLLSDREVNQIILPDFGNIEFISKNDLIEAKKCLKNPYNSNELTQKSQNLIKNYITGSAKICTDCFKGCFTKQQSLEILVPNDYSIMVEHEVFDNYINPKFILKNDMSAYKINRIRDTFFSHDTEFWTLIGHNNLEGINLIFPREIYNINNFEQSEFYNFEIAHFDSTI